MPPTLSSALDEQLTALEKARPWSPRVISKLEALLASEDPWALYRVNPIVFGRDKGIEESEAIDLFLHASRQGLFKLEWHLVCPSCGDAVESFESLSGLHTQFNCNMCQVNATASLDEHIEISFSVLPQVRDCPFHHPEALSVSDFYFRYHFNGQAHVPGNPPFVEILQSSQRGLGYLAAGSTTAFESKVEPGYLMGYDLLEDTGLLYNVDGDPTPAVQELKLTLSDEGYWPPQGKLRPGPVRVLVTNNLPRRAALLLAHLPPGYMDPSKGSLQLPPFLSGNRLLNTQTFRNLYRGETILGSEGIGVRDLALLFTDLKGSTAMYERIGDLKAFALVQQHFEHLTKAIGAHRGAVVKTIGDAVMASFQNGADAARAAVEMLKEIEDFNQSQGHREILLKVGIHRGPSIAVTLNEKLDYFGQTVNVAARVQGLADAEEICVTEAIWRLDGVPQALQGLRSSVEDTSIKGLSNKMRIHRFSPPTSRPKTTRAKKAAPAKKKAAPKKAVPRKKPKPAKKERQTLMRRALGIAFILLFAGACATTPKPAWVQDTLYFGLSQPKGQVTEAQWQAFVDTEITPRFPDGLTWWKAQGQWRGSDGKAAKEGSRVLQILRPAGSEAEAKIEAIRSAYKNRFKQESVLKVEVPVQSGF